MMAVAMYAQSPIKLALRPYVGVAVSNRSYNTTIAEARANAGFTAGVDLELGLLGIFKPSIGVNYAYQTAGTKDFNNRTSVSRGTRQASVATIAPNT